MGLREDRFDEPPFVGCGHQPPQYGSYLRDAGCRRVTGFRNYEIDLTSSRWRELSGTASGVTFRTASRRRFADEIATFMDLHNRAFAAVWGEAEVSLKNLPNDYAELSSGACHYKIVGMAPEDYPKLPKPENATLVKIDGKVLLEMIKKTSFAISTDETRYILNGVYL